MGMRAEVYAVSPNEISSVSADANAFAELTRYDNDSATSVSLEKSWHGLHFLLTGDAWEADGPLSFILAGGTEIAESDSGYGPARCFSPNETAQIHQHVSAILDDQLLSLIHI